MLLGLDWGIKKIGVAVAEEEIAIASAVNVVINDEHVFEELAKIIKEHGVELIVIGKSAHLSQSDNVQLIEQFGTQCQKNLNVNVVFVPEMFSTREAHANLKSAGKKQIDRNDDAESARIILQQYLDVSV